MSAESTLSDLFFFDEGIFSKTFDFIQHLALSLITKEYIKGT